MAIVRDRIVKTNLIICEGRDDENFLRYWLKSGVLSDAPGSDEIQFFNCDGNEYLPRKLAIYKAMDGFSDLRYLLIIRDAERDAPQAIRDVQSALRQNGFQVPGLPCQWLYDSQNDLNIGFLLFPTCDSNPTEGMLEDLCLKILAEPDAPICMEEIDLLLSRLEAKRGKKLSHMPKTRLHAYFAVSDDYVGLKAGEAAKAGAFDWSDARLESLRRFVAHMMESAKE